MDTKQLFEKAAKGYIPIYPLALMQDIIDKDSSISLADIINKFNHIYLTYQENQQETRVLIPDFLRRYGLFISYEKYGKLYTEYFKGSNMDAQQDERWADDSYWQLVPDLEYVNGAASRIPNGAILPEHLSDSLQQLLSKHHTINNMVDDEDLKSIDCGIIKFKDKDYEPFVASGKGYKILRKNWVAGENIITESDFLPNTIHEVRYDFNLNRASLSLPNGASLLFKGGSFNNGSMSFKNGTIIGLNKFTDGGNASFTGEFAKGLIMSFDKVPKWWDGTKWKDFIIKDVNDSNVININDINKFPKNKTEAIEILQKPNHNHYVVVAKVGSVVVTVGTLHIISDNMLHQFTEVLTTHYDVDENGNISFENAHFDNEVRTYWRGYGIQNNNNSSIEHWSEWREVVPKVKASTKFVKFSELDTFIIDYRDAQNKIIDPNNTYYSVIDDSMGTDVIVGSLQIISDNMFHQLTQIFITHYLVENGAFVAGGAHDDSKIFIYYRSYGISNNNNTNRGEWSDWKVYGNLEDGSVINSAEVTSVTTVPYNQSANATATVDGNKIKFTFDIPQGKPGINGSGGGGTIDPSTFGATATAVQSSSPTAEVNLVDNTFNFTFGLVKGEKGDKGERGADGANGVDGTVPNWKNYIYYLGDTKPTKPTSTDLIPAGWHDYPNTTGQWWQCIGTVNGITNKVETWSEVVPVNGRDGVAQDGKYTEMRFKWWRSNVSTPIIDRQLRNPDGWYTDPNVAGKSETNKYLWMSTARINPDDTLDGNWTSPVCISGEQGLPGENGPAGPAGPAGSQGVSGIHGVSFEAQYCLGTENSYTGSWTDSIPATTSANPYVWCKQGKRRYANPNDITGTIEWGLPFRLTGTNGLNGAPGENGKKGQMIYPAGIYDPTYSYVTDENKAPYVFDPTDANFYVLNRIMQWTGTIQGRTPSEDYALYGGKYWLRFDAFEAIYTKIGIIANGLIGSAVFNRNYMFSQQGHTSLGAITTNYQYFDADNPSCKFQEVETLPVTGDKSVYYYMMKDVTLPNGMANHQRFNYKWVGVSEDYPNGYKSFNITETFIPNMLIDFSDGSAIFSNNKVKFNADGSGYVGGEDGVRWRADGALIYNGFEKELFVDAEHNTIEPPIVAVGCTKHLIAIAESFNSDLIVRVNPQESPSRIYYPNKDTGGLLQADGTAYIEVPRGIVIIHLYGRVDEEATDVWYVTFENVGKQGV